MRGLCARGGYTVDISWRDGKLTVADIRRTSTAPAVTSVGVQVRYGKVTKHFAAAPVISVSFRDGQLQ